ncbi:MAG: diversity-generating retroelement protein Avd [Phototrophicaceae bacterium]
MSDDMIILTRTFDLLAWLLPKSEKFPKAYRFTITQRLMDSALDFQEALFDANSQTGSNKYKHLREADAHLNKMRLYLRLVHQWQWINDGQYRHVSAMIAEMGQLLGGWMKAV